MWSIDYVQVPADEEFVEAISVSPSKPKKKAPLAKISTECSLSDSEKVQVKNKPICDSSTMAKKRVEELVKQMSLSNDDNGVLTKSGSESSLSEAGDTASAKETLQRHEEKETCSDNEDNNQSAPYGKDNNAEYPSNEPPDNYKAIRAESASSEREEAYKENWNRSPSVQSQEDELASTTADVQIEEARQMQKQEAVILRRKSRGNPLFRKSEGGSMGDSTDSSGIPPLSESPLPPSVDITAPSSSQDDSAYPQTAAGGMRASKSDTSLTDSFVVIPPTSSASTAQVDDPNAKRKTLQTQNHLKEGLKWQRQLVFRSKLTMHTAYDRKDNTSPASVTCVTASKDGRGVAVGDARGRIFRWSVCEAGGRGSDHWVRDSGATSCTACSTRFTLYERRHHCRSCGRVFCGRCSRYEAAVARLRILRPVRVCQACHAELQKNDPETNR